MNNNSHEGCFFGICVYFKFSYLNKYRLWNLLNERLPRCQASPENAHFILTKQGT